MSKAPNFNRAEKNAKKLDAACALIVNAGHPLDGVESFVARFVAYPSEHCRIAHVLWIAHAHLMGAWESTPRIAFLSPEPGSGKSRSLEATELLVPNPVQAVNVTPAYLFRKIGDKAGAPTVLYDEIDTVFGPKAKENEEIRGLLNAGHRRGAVAGRCVVRGKQVFTEEIPAYSAVALAGLGALPDTILSRSIIVKMRRRAPGEHIEPYRRRAEESAGHALRDHLASWAARVAASVTGVWPAMPEGIVDRNADIWEALLAVADAAGGEWPKRARAAAVALVNESKAGAPSLGVRLLGDMRQVFNGRDHMSTDEVIQALCKIEEAPWGDLRGKPIDARGLAQRLKPYGVGSKQIRVSERLTLKGYARADLHDAWQRYLPATHAGSETCETAETPTAATEVERAPGHVSLVSHPREMFPQAVAAHARHVPHVSHVSHATGDGPTGDEAEV